MSKVVRSVKNVTKGYSSVQVKVRNATSNAAWGPTGAEMSEIAQMTFNGSNDFYEIVDMLDKRLNDKGKNWRHVLKSLKVVDYCLHEGSELVVTWARKNIYIIKTLREFTYIEDDDKDVGQNVRVSAKELTSLILDEERLRTERADRKTWKSRVTGIDEYGPSGSGLAGHGESSRPDGRRPRRKENTEEEDLELRLALEASKNEAEEDKRRRLGQEAAPVDDDDLAKAIRLSKEEEELRRRELEDSNAQSLFDDTPVQSQQPQYTGYNQGYQQGGAVDLFGNPVYQPQQQQNTGFLDNAYSQGFQPQQTGFQPQQTGFQMQPTGFDPNQQFQQQQPNYMQAQNTVQPQQTAFNGSNPYAQQSNDFGQFQQQQQPQQEPGPQAGAHNPWAAAPQAEPMKPAATGANNPFGAKFGQPQQPPQQQNRQPTLSALAQQQTTQQFTQPSPNPISSYSTPQQARIPQQAQHPQKEQTPQHARLNALLASGEGMDTFGNTGDLRVAAHHTASGAFVNSSGQGLNKLHATQTGNNPFFSQQQTGAQQNFVQQPGMMPAPTGFGGNQYGQGNNNPFGGQQQQQHQQNQGGGSLIDL